MKQDDDADPIKALLDVMAALRTPGTGCPWDLEQSFKTIAPYTIEEAYEVADAIERGDREDLKEELGDLLLQVVYHARLAQEEGSFAFADVARAITHKMVRRHPHVFGDERVIDAGAMRVRWDELKAIEKSERDARKGSTPLGVPGSALDGVPLALPALVRALKLQRRAARVGFDWDDVACVLGKLKEELGEIEEALATKNPDRIEEELGDLLFAAVNLARHLDVAPEDALKEANAKFVRRFSHIEARLTAEGKSIDQASLGEMDALWNDAKSHE